MNFSDDIIKSVWSRGRVVEGVDPTQFRKDACGAWIAWEKYGSTDNPFGWQIDHICPVHMLERLGFSSDAINNIRNLRPLHHQNNASKGDDYPSYIANVTSEGNKNISLARSMTINTNVQLELSAIFNL